jgi:hypothetical protein
VPPPLAVAVLLHRKKQQSPTSSPFVLHHNVVVIGPVLFRPANETRCWRSGPAASGWNETCGSGPSIRQSPMPSFHPRHHVTSSEYSFVPAIGDAFCVAVVRPGSATAKDGRHIATPSFAANALRHATRKRTATKKLLTNKTNTDTGSLEKQVPYKGVKF